MIGCKIKEEVHEVEVVTFGGKHGIVSGSAAPAVVCAGDFDNSSALGLGDVPGMVTALLTP